MGLIGRAGRVFRRFASDRRGVVAVTFGLCTLVLVMAAGGAFDLQRAYTARQQLSSVSALTCQYANRPIVVSLAFGSGGTAAYVAAVNKFYASALADQNFKWTQTTASPFAYVSAGPGTMTLTAAIPTTLMSIIGFKTIPVNIKMTCFTTLAALPQPVADATTTVIVNEGFENSQQSADWYTPTGQSFPASTNVYNLSATNTAPGAAGYVGSNGNEWIIMGYCLEVDIVGATQATVPQGTHGAELDCDNGSNSAGNSSISTKMWLQTGSYELRYYYASRVPNLYYGTSYICGTAASDTSWANDISYSYSNGSLGSRTNQVNVYLDQNTTGSPPTHTTLDGTQTLGGYNQIDQCVYSNNWIERSVLVNVTTAGYYWLSFAADGSNDSYGGDIDYIRFCMGTCTGPRGDDFPTAWLAANNGNVNPVLFEDTFESPTYTGSPYNNNGNIGLSYGSSYFWSESGHGWANAAVNQLPYWTLGCPQANQCIEIGWDSNETTVAKPFLLDPGYYQINYDYVSELLFSGLSSVYCGATPSAAGISTLLSGSGTATIRTNGGSPPGNYPWATGAVGLFVANAQMASEPVPSSTLGSTTTYTSPSGRSETTPSVPNNSINLYSFSQSNVSPLVDMCGYAATPQVRTAYVQIQKPGLYWIIFSTVGTYAGFGALVDDVKITALGSPWMSKPPSGAVLIPVPSPQPSSTVSFTGFSITADKY